MYDSSTVLRTLIHSSSTRRSSSFPPRGALVWLGRRIRTCGFELATYLITVAAAATAMMAMLTGSQARGTVSRDALLADLMREHLTNGVAAILWAKLIPN